MRKIFDSKIYKILITVIKSLFFIVIVLYLAFILIQRVNGNQSVFGYRLFTVATGSMIGVYDINDVIAVKDCDTSKLKVGDDIAYKGNRGGLEGMLITHRIVRIEDSEKGGRIYVTKGVNSHLEDPSITDSQILGKVVGVVPIVTQINHVVKNQLGFFLLVFCPLVLIIVLEVLETITEIRLEKNQIKRIKDTDTIEEPDKEEKESTEVVEEENKSVEESTKTVEEKNDSEEESTEINEEVKKEDKSDLELNDAELIDSSDLKTKELPKINDSTKDSSETISEPVIIDKDDNNKDTEIL